MALSGYIAAALYSKQLSPKGISKNLEWRKEKLGSGKTTQDGGDFGLNQAQLARTMVTKMRCCTIESCVENMTPNKSVLHLVLFVMSQRSMIPN